MSMTTAMHAGKHIQIVQALELRETTRKMRKPDPEFLCIECKARVIAFKKNKLGHIAHFEHHRNDDFSRCSQKHDN